MFPENGKFSTVLKSSIAVGETLNKWARNNYKDDKYSWSMGGRGEVNVNVNSGATSLEHFLGSVAVRIGKVDDKTIRVEIFNVTSFTSGNVYKDIPVVNWFTSDPTSTVRESHRKYPYLTLQSTYSNISQYFSFTMSTAEAGKIIKQFGGTGNASKK